MSRFGFSDGPFTITKEELDVKVKEIGELVLAESGEALESSGLEKDKELLKQLKAIAGEPKVEEPAPTVGSSAKTRERKRVRQARRKNRK